ncbi:ferredoxin [Streptomyces bathyalis]|uniref:Ferredoxin n=1 Tax=Streptomyces bathyalis TaxID=2710756 RepID=A0A7T1WUZ9_9ACTN|nr:ferredoxin [Streptomyces bathyalis]QPP10196.1 ferredoxin [Streptomyces bathyalis]
MRITVDAERCIGAGMCALTAAEVFDQDPDDGHVLLLRAEPPAVHRAAAQMAAGVCPSGAITINGPESSGS